jgi:MFS transporter, SP family, general alpha glucoside:H+ symporter
VQTESKLRSAGKSIRYIELLKGTNPIRFMISACTIMPLFMGTSFWPSYQTYCFELAGVQNTQGMNYGATSVAVAANLVAYLLVDTWGRRQAWIFGAAGMMITNLIGAFMYIPQQKGHAQSAAAAATAMVFLWNAYYEIGPANMGYAIGAEVPSSRMRIKKIPFLHVCSHLISFGFSYAVPYMYNPDAGNLGLRIGFVWGGFGVII